MKTDEVWVVSFGIGETGQFENFQIDEYNLNECTVRMAEQLRGLIGSGVFTRREDAELWAQSQLQPKGCGGGCGGGGCGSGDDKGCGCPHKRG